MHDVYISCCPEDFLLAEKLRNQLMRNGISCRMAPDSTPAGSNYTEAIQAAIYGSGTVLAVITENALQARSVLEELELAVSSGKRIVPVLMENCRLTTEIRFLIGGEHHLFAFQMDESSLEQQLLYRIRGNHSGMQPPAKEKPAAPGGKVNLRLVREKQFYVVDCPIKAMTEDGATHQLKNGGDTIIPVSPGKQVIQFTGSFRKTKIELDLVRDSTLLVKWNRWTGHIDVEALSQTNMKILQKR